MLELARQEGVASRPEIVVERAGPALDGAELESDRDEHDRQDAEEHAVHGAIEGDQPEQDALVEHGATSWLGQGVDGSEGWPDRMPGC